MNRFKWVTFSMALSFLIIPHLEAKKPTVKECLNAEAQCELQNNCAHKKNSGDCEIKCMDAQDHCCRKTKNGTCASW